jgi:hypothetical protein
MDESWAAFRGRQLFGEDGPLLDEGTFGAGRTTTLVSTQMPSVSIELEKGLE